LLELQPADRQAGSGPVPGIKPGSGNSGNQLRISGIGVKRKSPEVMLRAFK